MAAMSVIGIDFGNESCYVAVARAGGIETIANDYSLRATPSCVAFSEKTRILGVAAKNQLVTNMKNTVYGFKRLLGRQYKDPFIQKDLQSLTYQTVETPSGGVGIKVNYLNEPHVFHPEQITAMLLTKLKAISEEALNTKINDCVISVPSYFTNTERKALLNAASIAGLNVLRLFNETTATALAYGIYKQDLPPPEEKPRNVVFVDCGYSSLQVSACAFHKGKLKMLACAADPDLGGHSFDVILAEHLSKDLKARYNINPMTNARAYTRLLTEVDKLKKQMSANSTKLPLNIECFMEDKDVHCDMKRADMEELCAGLFQRVEKTLRQCLEDSKLKLEDIHAVEIVGGSSRVPAIKQLIEVVFNKPASTTLNQDEAVARGCALQCAMLSPAVRVRDFAVTDIQMYPVHINWDGHDAQDQGEMEVFSKNHAAPFSKVLTLYKKESFNLKAFYPPNSVPYPDPRIGEYCIKNIKPTAQGGTQKVKLKIRINIHGIVSVSSASLIEQIKGSAEPMDVEVNEEEHKEKEQPAQETTQEQQQPPEANANSQDAQPNGPAEDDDAEKKEKKRKTVKSVDLPIEEFLPGFSSSEVSSFFEAEGQMMAADRQEKDRVDARNSLEEYVYELRGKLSEELSAYVVEKDRSSLVEQLDQMENWLYEEGEECVKQVYMDKLGSLRRKMEYEARPKALEELSVAIQLAFKNLEQYKAREDKLKNLDPATVEKSEQNIRNLHHWCEEKRAILSATPLHQNPPVSVAEILAEKEKAVSEIKLLSTMPKVAPEPAKQQPPPEQSQESTQDEKMKTENGEQD
nr:heat shock protein [Bemisia tabaci]